MQSRGRLDRGVSSAGDAGECGPLAAREAWAPVSVVGGGAPRGSTQVPRKLLSDALASGPEGQSLRQERGACGWAEGPGRGDGGGTRAWAVPAASRPLIRVLRFGSQGQDLTPILMASAVH